MRSTQLYFILILLVIPVGINAKQAEQSISYGIINEINMAFIHQIDHVNGTLAVWDSVDLSKANYTISHGIQWQEYDPVNLRIFFQEALTWHPIYVHVYEISTRHLFDLPYANYSGDPVDMLITPGSKYIIFSYLYRPIDTLNWANNIDKTVVLDGNSLSLISEKIGFNVMPNGYPYKSFASADNKLLFHTYAEANANGVWLSRVVSYSLPNLVPFDTLYLDQIGWNGDKKFVDALDYKLLLQGSIEKNIDSLTAGNYLFLIDGHNGKVISPFVSIDTTNGVHYLLTPTGDEALGISEMTGVIRRYSMTTGQKLGEIQVSGEFRFPYFLDDGNLYGSQLVGTSTVKVVVDYRNNRIARTFQMQEVNK